MAWAQVIWPLDSEIAHCAIALNTLPIVATLFLVSWGGRIASMQGSFTVIIDAAVKLPRRK